MRSRFYLHLSSMSPDIDTLTPPCTCSRLSSLAEPLRGHQLWRGIDGTRTRVQTPSNPMYWETPLERIHSWVLVSPPMGLELESQLGLLLFPTCEASSLGRWCWCYLHILNCPVLSPATARESLANMPLALMQPMECVLAAENDQSNATSVVMDNTIWVIYASKRPFGAKS